MPIAPRRTLFQTPLPVAPLAALFPLFAAGCISRPIAEVDPEVMPYFVTTITTKGIDQVDLLFAIDNSGSMADKQEILGAAIPRLVGRLVNPICRRDAGTGAAVGPSVAGDCSTIAGGDVTIQPEFPAVRDLHVGIVTSSLGTRGGALCDPSRALGPSQRHVDDGGRLVNRTKGPTRDADGPPDDAAAANGGFLSFYTKRTPKPEAYAAERTLQDPNELVARFTKMVTGVQEYGCGFEAQLESVYRFLFQPDPYASIAKDTNGTPTLVGVDAEVLRQRRAFLRPNSRVAVVMVTDENDSTVDPTSLEVFENRGVQWSTAFLDYASGAAPRGTAACETSPMSPACVSCRANPSDAACGGSPRAPAPDGDGLNVRFFQPKRRFGHDPQFPIARYIDAFTSRTLPNRRREHDGARQYDASDAAKVCTNPIFAADLPNPDELGDANAAIEGALCKRPLGPRTPYEVIFSLIGGVPWQLLTTTSDPATAELQRRLREEGWTKVLGRDPLRFDFTGADPHMLESSVPRPGLPAPSAGNGLDPIHGREWDTRVQGVANDLQYACTFTLPTPKPNGPDCVAGVAPLCNGTTQVKAKAYPTVRELALARALEKSDQSVVASICPIDLTPGNESAVTYGYNPAAGARGDRIALGLRGQCLPRELALANGEAPCLLVETRQERVGTVRCTDADIGREDPSPELLARIRSEQPEGERDKLVCVIPQITKLSGGASCAARQEPGWCYVTGPEAMAGTCKQPFALHFSPKGAPAGTIRLACILGG